MALCCFSLEQKRYCGCFGVYLLNAGDFEQFNGVIFAVDDMTDEDFIPFVNRTDPRDAEQAITRARHAERDHVRHVSLVRDGNIGSRRWHVIDRSTLDGNLMETIDNLVIPLEQHGPYRMVTMLLNASEAPTSGDRDNYVTVEPRMLGNICFYSIDNVGEFPQNPLGGITAYTVSPLTKSATKGNSS